MWQRLGLLTCLPKQALLLIADDDPQILTLLSLRFSNTSLMDLLRFIGSSTGINVTFDRNIPGAG